MSVFALLITFYNEQRKYKGEIRLVEKYNIYNISRPTSYESNQTNNMATICKVL